jgi:acetyl/propionyl-CoA carboxylase alpha subunit
MPTRLKRTLIANRGEIAARIARTCGRLGIEYVGVYADADRDAPYLEGAVDAVHLGASAPLASYLDSGKLIDAAKRSGCDSVHPGYGFLSENAAFAAAVEAAGLVFIGPSPATIDALGDKARAKALMAAAGVPVLAGSAEASENLERIAELAVRIGFPVLLKPSAGGGGKGMQIVTERRALDAAAAQAIRLGRANFGDGRVLVERFLESPRHVEVQIFGDCHGNVVHVFERECSLQRRHQKVIEEAPAAHLPAATRAALLDAAVKGARAIGYRNAGTFEFLVGAAGEFYFLEVNTRLQVEHPVSEAVSGLDFVEWQLRIAAGEALPLPQHEITCRGHAIECRLYAEDPLRDFRPAPGRVERLHWPDGVRLEIGLGAAAEVAAFYDPMIAKLIVHAADRAAAIEKARLALDETMLLGLTTNLGFLAQVLADAGVRGDEFDTRYLDRHLERYVAAVRPGVFSACAAFIDLLERARDPAEASPWRPNDLAGVFDRIHLDPKAPWGQSSFWRGDTAVEARMQELDARGVLRVAVGDVEFHIAGSRSAGGLWTGTVDATRWYGAVVGDRIDLQVGGHHAALETYAHRDPAPPQSGGLAVATMPGAVVAIPVAVGELVEAGATLAIVEAMKMENPVVAAAAGRVSAIHCALGDNVRAGDTLVSIET